jgi:hypothetical protein
MSSEWSPLETTAYQDHVIAHVLGATVLGYFEDDQAAHVLLDIGFFWTIYVDGDMALVLQSLAIKEFELAEEIRTALFADVQSLHGGLADDESLLRMRPVPAGALIKEVGLYALEDRRRILIECEKSKLLIESSLSTGDMQIIVELSNSNHA